MNTKNFYLLEKRYKNNYDTTKRNDWIICKMSGKTSRRLQIKNLKYQRNLSPEMEFRIVIYERK